MNILLMSRYDNLGASSRYRCYQYINYLNIEGIEISVAPLFNNDYLKDLYNKNKRNFYKILKAYIRRIVDLYKARKYDLIWLEKEALPWLPVWIEYSLALSKVSYIVDYVDAIFHNYDKHKLKLVQWVLGSKIDFIMKKAKAVIVGNDYLFERANKIGVKKVYNIPTVVNLDKYKIFSKNSCDNDIFTIGWIGTPITSHYLNLILPALKYILINKEVRLKLIGAKRKKFLEDLPIEYISWSEDTEVKEIQKIDVGIMPLPDNHWEKGKCGLKLIQYMACGKPVIGSPVGVNKKIIEHGINGFLAQDNNEWIWAIEKLIDDAKLRKKIGRAARMKEEKEYNLSITAPLIRKIIISAININKT